MKRKSLPLLASQHVASKRRVRLARRIFRENYAELQRMRNWPPPIEHPGPIARYLRGWLGEWLDEHQLGHTPISHDLPYHSPIDHDRVQFPRPANGETL